MSSSVSSGDANVLPPLVLVNIFCYLNRKALLSAASVCKRWREMIIGHRSFHFWSRQRPTLNLKPSKGLYSDEEHKFHLLMCEKYALFSKQIILNVCQCQQQNFVSLVSKLAKQNSSLKSVTFRKASLNNCCRFRSVHLGGQGFVPKLIKFGQHFRYLYNLSFGFDCDWCILKALDSIFSEDIYCLKMLNVATVSRQKPHRHFNLSWLLKFNEVTINWELLTENVLRSWLELKSSAKLQVLKLVLASSTEELKAAENVELTTEYEHDETSIDLIYAPLQETWSALQTEFQSLQIHLILVSTAFPLSSLLNIVSVRIPVSHITAIFTLYPFPQRSSFEEWFVGQNSPQLESLRLHGMEPPGLRLLNSKEGEEWLDFCRRSVSGLKHFAISGMFLPDSNLMKFMEATSDLKDLQISKHDIIMNSVVQLTLQIAPNNSQLRYIESHVSYKMRKVWKAGVKVPLQYANKNKGFGILDIARALLHKYEDEHLQQT